MMIIIIIYIKTAGERSELLRWREDEDDYLRDDDVTASAAVRVKCRSRTKENSPQCHVVIYVDTCYYTHIFLHVKNVYYIEENEDIYTKDEDDDYYIPYLYRHIIRKYEYTYYILNITILYIRFIIYTCRELYYFHITHKKILFILIRY